MADIVRASGTRLLAKYTDILKSDIEDREQGCSKTPSNQPFPGIKFIRIFSICVF